MGKIFHRARALTSQESKRVKHRFSGISSNKLWNLPLPSTIFLFSFTSAKITAQNLLRTLGVDEILPWSTVHPIVRFITNPSHLQRSCGKAVHCRFLTPEATSCRLWFLTWAIWRTMPILVGEDQAFASPAGHSGIFHRGLRLIGIIFAEFDTVWESERSTTFHVLNDGNGKSFSFYVEIKGSRELTTTRWYTRLVGRM